MTKGWRDEVLGTRWNEKLRRGLGLFFSYPEGEERSLLHEARPPGSQGTQAHASKVH